MNFDEAHDKLNDQDLAAVAAEMLDWHPRILGSMLMAVQSATTARYLSPHPHYHASLLACLDTDPKPHRTSPLPDSFPYQLSIHNTIAELRSNH